MSSVVAVIVDNLWAANVALIVGGIGLSSIGVAVIVDNRWPAGVAAIVGGVATIVLAVSVLGARASSAVDDSQAPEQLTLFDMETDEGARYR